MIRSIIQAGFGNQLFQYATAYALARELRQPLELDVSFFNWYNQTHPATARRCAMSLLQLQEHKVVDGHVHRWWRYEPLFSLPISYWPWYPGGLPVIRENLAHCREDQSKLFRKIGHQGAALFGFWQNTSYFDNYLLDLKTQFQPNYNIDISVRILWDQIIKKESIGVHVRRGDFVNLGWDKGLEYYIKGMEWIQSQKEKCRFYIFTDDKLWVREQFPMCKDVTIIDISTETSEIDEFFLLSSCKHQIISESTFGWWAAYLNTNKDKLIVIPHEAKGQIFNERWHRM